MNINNLNELLKEVNKQIDIYIPTKEKFAYLFLITDAYSRKIVGFQVSDDMKVSGAVVVLNKALVQKPVEPIVIHRSDSGIQYCNTAYVNHLQERHALIKIFLPAAPLTPK